MKKIASMLGIIFISSLVSIVPASAGDCSPEDPCLTYAEVNSSGTVVNVIVCQPSVCDIEWGGVHPINKNKLVKQVAADSNGNNRGSVFDAGGSITVTESGGTFTVTNNNPATHSINETSVNQNNGNQVDASASATTSNGGKQSFTFENSVNPQNDKNQVVDFGKTSYENNTSATVSATKIETNENTVVSTTSVEKTFDNPVTEEQFELEMKDENIWNNLELNLIFSFFDFWLDVLVDWFLSL